MNKLSKKYIKTTVLSLALFTGAVVGFNGYNLQDYNSHRDQSIEQRADNIKNIDNYQSLQEQYNSFNYTEEEYQKDKAFFNQVFSKNYYHLGYDKQFRLGYMENVQKSLNDYIRIYYLYKGDTSSAIKIQEILQQWKDNKISYEQLTEELIAIRSQLYKNYQEKIYSTATFYNSFMAMDSQQTQINNYNKIFISNNLKPFLMDDAQYKKIINDYQIAFNKKDDNATDNMYLKNNKIFSDFVDSIKNGNANDKQMHDFFKTIRFINDNIQKNESLYASDVKYYNIIDKNDIFSKSVNVIENMESKNNTYYKTIVEKDLNSEQKSNLFNSRY